MRYALAALSIGFTVQTASADSLPPPVAAAVQDAKSSCGAGRATIGKGFLRKQTVSGGLPDYVISYAGVSCSTGGHMNCGSGGCLTQVFSAASGQYTKVLDQNVQKLQFKTVGGKPAMILYLNGSECGRFGYQVCKSVRVWNGTAYVPAS